VALRRIDGSLGAVGALAGTTNNLAASGSDFEETILPIPWGQGGSPHSWGSTSERVLSIPIFSDEVIEGDELFGLGLTLPIGSIDLSGDPIPTGAALGRSRSIVTITDDDFSPGVFAFSSPTYSTNEGAIFARITVVRTNGSAGSVSVRYFTTDGTAIAGQGQDYTAAQGTLTFGSAVTSQSFTVRLNDDLSVEPDEVFSVTLTNAAGGAQLPDGTPTSTLSATVKIIDNDFLPGKANFVSPTLVNPAPFATNEGAFFARVTLERLGGSVGELSVDVGTGTGGSATPGTDYTPVTNRVTWVHGDVAPKTVLVHLEDDFDVEANETVLLRIFNPNVAAGVGSISNATLTIRNDDFYGSLTFSQPIYDTDERGTNIWITVVRTGGSGGMVSANYQVVAGTAIPAPPGGSGDFTPTSGTLTFGPGVVATNFSVVIFNNDLTDGDRTVLLSLSGFMNATPGADPTATLNIIDDESTGDPAGTLDSTFNLNAGANESINALALQPDGKILAAGAFRMMNRVTRTRIARLNPDGVLDDTFDPRQGPNAQVRAILLQPPPDPFNQPNDYRVVLAGQFTEVAGTNRNYIARLLADGTVDNAFNPGGGADNPVFALAHAPEGGVVLGGAFATINGIPRPGVAILDYSGTVRSSFDPGVGANAAVLAVAVQNDGKILVGGEFTSFNGVSLRHLARLNINGTVDVTFTPGSGPDAPVRAIALQPDGSILIGGSFTNVDGAPRSRFARLSSTGALDPLFQDGTGGANRDVLAIAVQYDTKILVA
ncbi:MAG TPA: Calx-beta domain-containing protein, partial [Verrucomicrobiae bacterium]|nr:Calx-beta domain-containing protein [Verrucomicrobiae bacterium]